MKIVVTNTVTLNGGDAAILHALMHIVRRAHPSAELVAFDSQAEIAARYHPDVRYEQLIHDTVGKGRFRRLHLARLLAAASLWGAGLSSLGRRLATSAERVGLRTYADADLVISTGGTYLVPQYDIRHRLFELELLRRLGKPVVFFTQSLGPFDEPSRRRSLQRLFAASPLVLLRDERSRAHLLDLGVEPAKLHVVADAVFALADEATLASAAGRELDPSRPLRVALSVRNWSHFRGMTRDEGMRRYREAMAALVHHLVRQRHAEVTFVSTCQGISEYWTDDASAAEQVLALVDANVRPQVTIDRDFHRPEALQEILGGFDLVVATRMHVAILALIGGTPVLPIAYEFKTEELFAGLGFGDWVQPMEKLVPANLVAGFEAWAEALSSTREALFAAVARERDRALSAADLVAELSRA